MSFKIEWDRTGERFYETGVTRGVHYLQDKDGNYTNGVAWNGLTSVTESPSGADITDMWADDTKYASIRAAEDFGATIEAYTYPDQFAECDGSAELVPGITIGQQNRKTFGFCYRTKVSNDLGVDGYKIHIIYGASASPSERGYTTINDSPDAITFSWEINTTPINVAGHKPTACLTINSLLVDAERLGQLENMLYGNADIEPHLPLPDEIYALFAEPGIGNGDEEQVG